MNEYPYLKKYPLNEKQTQDNSKNEKCIREHKEHKSALLASNVAIYTWDHENYKGRE